MKVSDGVPETSLGRLWDSQVVPSVKGQIHWGFNAPKLHLMSQKVPHQMASSSNEVLEHWNMGSIASMPQNFNVPMQIMMICNEPIGFQTNWYVLSTINRHVRYASAKKWTSADIWTWRFFSCFSKVGLESCKARSIHLFVVSILNLKSADE